MTDVPASPAPPTRILLATDLSARCDRALDRAAALATAWKAELIAVHARETRDALADAGLERRPASWLKTSDPAETAARQLRRDAAGAAVNVAAIVEPGDPADLILRVAGERGCGLIVTGIARDETFGRFGLGTTVDRLLRRSSIPLLIVRQRARAPYRSLVVASDFSESSLYALKVATGLFPGAPRSVFHAYRAPQTALGGDPESVERQYREVAIAEGAAFLAKAGIPGGDRPFDLIAEPGDPADLIPRYVEDQGIDLVALGTHGRSALFDIFIGSAAKEILAAVPCDALIVREPRAAVES